MYIEFIVLYFQKHFMHMLTCSLCTDGLYTFQIQFMFILFRYILCTVLCIFYLDTFYAQFYVHFIQIHFMHSFMYILFCCNHETNCLLLLQVFFDLMREIRLRKVDGGLGGGKGDSLGGGKGRKKRKIKCSIL